jgi:hypothetical protein
MCIQYAGYRFDYELADDRKDRVVTGFFFEGWAQLLPSIKRLTAFILYRTTRQGIFTAGDVLSASSPASLQVGVLEVKDFVHTIRTFHYFNP